VEAFTLAWASIFFDFDNDMIPDLFVCSSTGVNLLYRNSPSWPLSDIASQLNVDDAASSYGAAVADIDNDGDLDLMVQNNFDRIRLYINHEGQTRRWIKFRVFGPGQNRFAIGGRVRVRIGSVWQEQEIIAGGNSYKSQNDLVLHFGADTALTVDEVVIVWPGGDISTFEDLATNQTHILRVPGPPIPAASTWGLGVLALLVFTSGTILCLRRQRVQRCV